MPSADFSQLSQFVAYATKRFPLSGWAVSVDANEPFCSDHRCCEDCLRREITCRNADGQEVKKTQYYHKQVDAQWSGPQWSAILDFEPMRPGEEECAAAWRLLRRMRGTYGPRFLDVVVVDSWYAHGPFLKAVVEELGWPVIAVLKQERYEVHQEAHALSREEKPTQVVERDGRTVEMWDVTSLRFTDTYPGPVRVVRVRERWKVENNAFGELTQHWHLTHCAHPHPVAVVALLWIKLLAFTLVHAFALLHGKLFRLGRVTLQEVRKQLYRSLLCGCPVRFFSSG